MVPLLQRTGFRIEELFQALVFFVIFLLPVVRGIVESRRKRAEAEAARQATGRATDDPDETRDSGEPSTGREIWEQLLRGERGSSDAPEADSTPPPARPRQRPPSQPRTTLGTPPDPRTPRRRRRRPAPAASAERPRPVGGSPLGRLEDTVSENQLETRRPAAPSLEGLSLERSAPASTGGLSLEGSSPGSTGGASPPRRSTRRKRSAAPGASPFAGLGPGLPAVDLGGLGSAFGEEPLPDLGDLDGAAPQATAWRRAVVLAELLGPPLALRAPGSGPSAPPGLDT